MSEISITRFIPATAARDKVNSVKTANNEGSNSGNRPGSFDEQRQEDAPGDEELQDEGSFLAADATEHLTDPDSGQLEMAVAKLNEYVQTVQRDIIFGIDSGSAEPSVTVVDRESRKLVRQFGSKEALELAKKVDIRKLAEYQQSDPDAYSYTGGLCLANQGLLEFVEMFKAPIKVLHPLLTATQEGNFKGTEGFGAIPFDGIVMAHSNESEWKAFKNNKNNEAFLDRIYVVKVPYCLRVTEEVKIYEKLIGQSNLQGVHVAPNTLRVASMFAP